jgi:lipoic acid synthetase/lipoyl(octanoyl) transferase
MILDLGVIKYEGAYAVQKELLRRRRLGKIGDSALLAEHEAVFTIGRPGSRKNLLVDEGALNAAGIRVIDTDRGGDITFHGPGGLVVYPVIDLKYRSRDLHRYLRELEDLAINFLAGYAVDGERVESQTGVWARGGKIAFIGVGASDWVTYHGLSININIDLGYFGMINPCGLKGARVTSLAGILGAPVPMGEAKARMTRLLRGMFDLSAGEGLARDYAAMA